MISANADADRDMNEKTRDLDLLQKSWLIHAGVFPPRAELSKEGHIFEDVFVKEVLCASITRVAKILKIFDAQFTIEQITTVMGVTSSYAKRVLIENNRIKPRPRGEKVAVDLLNSEKKLIKKYESINKLSKDTGITVYKILNAIERADGFLADGLFVKVS